MFNNCNRVLIENVSRNSVCFSFKPFVLLSTYARSIYQVVCVRSPLATVDFVSLKVFSCEPILRYEEPLHRVISVQISTLTN